MNEDRKREVWKLIKVYSEYYAEIRIIEERTFMEEIYFGSIPLRPSERIKELQTDIDKLALKIEEILNNE